MSNTTITTQAQLLSDDAYKLSEKINELIATQSNVGHSEIDPFILTLTILKD